MKKELVDAWVKRANEVLVMTGWEALPVTHQFSLSLVAAMYGPSSVQFRGLREYIDAALRNTKNGDPDRQIAAHARGAIESTLADIKAGLIVDARAQIQGEVIGELVMLAKDALADKTEPGMHVAAVLTAAAFEDVLRRLAEEKAGLTGRPKLESVIGVLKDADLIKGGELTTATSYLKFRNDSLHADWPQIYRVQVEGCLNFVESLLVKHFS
jgi:hypothetical protein